MEKARISHHERPRIKTLDSLRGFASLSVVLFHLSAGLFYSTILTWSPLAILVQAHTAVIFFFVLSGYVLIYQYGTDPNYTYGRFLVQRFVRLYIPYIASIALAFALNGLCDTRPTSKIWLTTLWKEPITTKDIVAHILLITDFNTYKLNTVVWSLVHEMRVSILFPVLLLITRLRFKNALLISAIIYLIAVLLDISNIDPPSGYLNSYLYTAIFLYTFSCGAIIARYQKQIVAWFAKLKKNQKRLLLLISILIYTYTSLTPYLAAKIGLSTTVVNFVSDYIIDISATIASAIFLIFAVANKPAPFFVGWFPVFLGRISYSLYLVHIPISVFVFYHLINKLPAMQIAIIALACSFLTAIIFNMLIERPAMRLGKKLLSL